MPSSDQSFAVLARFLSCFQGEVVGHAATLTEDDRNALARLAAGEVTQNSERDRLVTLLLQSPGALAWFAELIRKN